jgi:hypothetical protein
MVVLVKNTVLFFFVIASNFIFSQEIDTKLGSDEASFLALASQEKINQSVTAKKDLVFENLIQSGNLYIKQIGKYNDLKINVNAASIEVEVLQNGDNNQIELDKEANSIKQKMAQDGQNNSIKDFSMYTNNNVNTEFIQQGNNQSIQSYGSNSISENMKVIQSGNGAAVIIINRK